LIHYTFHTRECKLAIFKQIARPLLEFCCQISSHYSLTELHLIEGVQRKFTRALFISSDTPCYRLRCEQLKLEPLWLRRIKLNLRYLHRLIYRLSHFPGNPLKLGTPSNYDLRTAAVSLSYPRFRTCFQQYSFLCHYPKLWNKLPIHLRNLCSPIPFSKAINEYLTPESVRTLLALGITLDDLYESGPGHY
jgi:hypothetical protein